MSSTYDQYRDAELIAFILDYMETYGGSFVKLLAGLYRHADHRNKEKILSTWSNYFDEYRDHYASH